jgi:hypothetical protein
VVSSVCWWTALFLVLAALTVESLYSAPAQLRITVAAAAAAILLAGFYFNYAGKNANSGYAGWRRFNGVMLWVVAGAVVLYAVLR